MATDARNSSSEKRRALSEAGMCSEHPSRHAVARYRSRHGRVTAKCAACDVYWKYEWRGLKPSGDEWSREDLTASEQPRAADELSEKEKGK